MSIGDTISVVHSTKAGEADPKYDNIVQGAAALSIGHYKRAIDHFSKASHFKTDSIVARQLGEAYEGYGNIKKAESYYRYSIENNKRNPLAYLRLANLLVEHSRGAEASVLLKLARSRSALHPDLAANVDFDFDIDMKNVTASLSSISSGR